MAMPEVFTHTNAMMAAVTVRRAANGEERVCTMGPAHTPDVRTGREIRSMQKHKLQCTRVVTNVLPFWHGSPAAEAEDARVVPFRGGVWSGTGAAVAAAAAGSRAIGLPWHIGGLLAHLDITAAHAAQVFIP